MARMSEGQRAQAQSQGSRRQRLRWLFICERGLSFYLPCLMQQQTGADSKFRCLLLQCLQKRIQIRQFLASELNIESGVIESRHVFNSLRRAVMKIRRARAQATQDRHLE